MWTLIKAWVSGTGSKPAPEMRVVRRSPDVSGKYVSLYRYLENRYADCVVLTFGQIEDLLGFALPVLARTLPTWWTKTEAGADAPPYSDAWTMAGRTATPNLPARHVIFERTLTPTRGRR